MRLLPPGQAPRWRAGNALRLLELLRPCFARVESWLQAGKDAAALMSQIPTRNGWTIAEHAGDRTPDNTQRLLSRADGSDEGGYRQDRVCDRCPGTGR